MDRSTVRAERDGLVIQVIGGSNRGKTTVARLIEEMLRGEGFTDVSIHDDPLDSKPNKAPIEQRVAATKLRPVCIKTVMSAKYR